MDISKIKHDYIIYANINFFFRTVFLSTWKKWEERRDDQDITVAREHGKKSITQS